MPERGRHHQSNEYRSRDKHYSHNRDYSGYDVEDRGSAGDRRARENMQRDVTPASHKEAPAYRDYGHEGTSRWPRETSMNLSERENYEQQLRPTLYNFRYILSSRGLIQLGEIFVNLLIIICAGVPYSNNGGYRDLASLGGIYYYQFGGAGAFTGADAQKVQELDRQFHQLKRPPYIFAMVVGGILLIYACVMLGLGIFRVPFRCPPVLLVEAILNFLIGLGYIPGMAIFFIKLKEVYDSPICKEREQMYQSKGHKGFECQYHGADIAEGLFGVLGVLCFIFCAVLAVKAFRSVRELKKQRTIEGNDF
ncbi:MARVEL domain-containing protein 3 [Archocentrus centrarchus]|uniref:MARVEL domain-containing protein 3 n=1 Tax=Archocentrus centrarchus TaxID=63155 RepID=UPI0011E9E704|nr:MARVEL domain-containing protein 3 [Archocentrus centrarchus]XP_030582081.1 MARVEL domain-containing protein 3 [Archocentrus centrarchus]